MTAMLATASCRVYCGQRSYFVTDAPEKGPGGPPPVIGTDRALHYAILNDGVGYSPGQGLLSVDGKELGKVPCLAICQAKGSSEFLLYHCALDWSILAVGAYDSVAAAKRRADRIYPSSSACWTEAHVTEQDATRYLDETWAGLRCSFCGKRPDETHAEIFEGDANARICARCIAALSAEAKDASR
jgi:hypothetical protein